MRVGAFASCLGAQRPIDTLPELARDPTRLARMKKHGLGCYMEATVPQSDMMVEAIRGALDQSGLDPLGIDTLVYSASTFDDRQEAALIPSMLHHCGLKHARPVGVFLGFCANFTYAFEVLEGLRTIGRSRRALLLFSDRYPQGSSRILRQDAAVGSDGVACCIVSDELESGYDIGAVRHHHDVEAAKHIESGDIVSYVRAYSNGVRLSAEGALGAAGVSPSDCVWMVTANFSQVVLRNLSELSGIETARIYGRNVAELGHCASADQLIALAQILDSNIADGAPVLVTGPAETVWGASVLRTVKPRARADWRP